MFGESVFALIPDDDVRAAKVTNRWISGCWWGDASSDEHLVGTKHVLLKCRSVRRTPPGEQWSRRETVEARGTKWKFDVEMDSGVSGPPVASRQDEGIPTATAQEEIPTVPPTAPPPDSHVLEMRGQGVHAKALRISAFWSEIGRTPGRDGWIWRLHGAMNGMRTASRDFTEFLAGILPEHMGFKRGKLERCLFVHESNETRAVSHVDDPLICAKLATLEKFWMQRSWSLTREEKLSTPPRSCGLPGVRVPNCTRR